MLPAREQPIRLVLVDDHTLMRQGMARLLADQPDMKVIKQLSSGEEIIDIINNSSDENISEESLDVLILDARMPGLGSIETARQLLESQPDLKIIALSSVASGVIPSQLLRGGVQGFLTKRVDMEELCTAIRQVHGGQRYICAEVATKLAVDPFNQRDSLFDKLSRREMQIAQMLTDGKKVSQISGVLELSPKTVYSYRYRIFEKLGIRSDVELTILAVRHGLTDDTRELADLDQLERFAS
ncbi:MAG: UvrY/SirA/GacA family response regulator transcription factor [Pseudohongiellaceae bacterium]|jgi:two-component system invasion response regulator UvrY